MKYILILIIGILVGVGAYWYLAQPKGQATAHNAQESVRETASNAGQSLKETFDTDKIKDELSRTGKVIREKAKQAGDATANARTTAAIKTKLVGDSGLSAFKIDVDTTDGVVTLSGTVPTYEAIGKAMSIAYDTDGVNKVVSTLQVKAN